MVQDRWARRPAATLAACFALDFQAPPPAHRWVSFFYSWVCVWHKPRQPNPPKQHSGIAESLAAQGVDLIDPPLMERAAFSAIFEFGGNLRSMPAQGNMDGAIENAALFAQAVYKRLAEGV